MAIDEIRRRIAAVDGIVTGWEREGTAAAIERDIVLARLREVYEMVRDLETGGHAVDAPPPDTSTEDCSGDAPAAEDAMEGHLREITESFAAAAVEDAPEEEPTGESAAERVEEEAWESVDPAVSEAGNIEEEAPAPRNPSTRKTLMSLYEDDRDPVAAPAPAAPGEQTVSDMFAARRVGDDVASRLQSAPVNMIRTSIGINDKFLIIRDLFDGDASRYDRVIDKLDSFDSLDDAMIYIYENYDWRPDSPAVAMLVDLLERKLG